MIRWLALWMLIASCNGCMMFDDMYYDTPPQVQPQPNSCNVPAGPVNVAQSAEPELLQTKR